MRGRKRMDELREMAKMPYKLRKRESRQTRRVSKARKRSQWLCEYTSEIRKSFNATNEK